MCSWKLVLISVILKVNFVHRRRRYVAEAGQRHRQSPFRWFGRCVLVRHASGTSAAGDGRQARLPAKPAAGTLPTHRQQTSHETLRLQEGADEGAHQAESSRALGYTSVQ